MKPNPVVWFEIYVQDLERARRFYEAVFQCKLEPLAPPEPAPTSAADCAPANMRMLSFPMGMDAPGSGGMLVQTDGAPSGGGGTMVYFACEDCAVEQARVAGAGGQVHRAKFSIAPYGHCAIVQDTEGNMIGLHSMQ